MENVAGVLVKDVTAKLGRSSRAQAEMEVFMWSYPHVSVLLLATG